MQAISYKDKTEFLIEFKKVYNACSQEEALQLLEAMKKKWEKYSVLLQDWFYDIDVWGKYFKYSYPLRKLIYSTNVIENFN
jgi:transposase-like protein